MRDKLGYLRRLGWRGAFFPIVFMTMALQMQVDTVSAKPLYSYRDEQDNNVITDNYERIPARYRAKVITVEQETERQGRTDLVSKKVTGFLKEVDEAVGGTTVDMPGMSPYQSHTLTVAGGLGLFFLLLRRFGRNQAVRFLSLWGLVMLGLVTPVLLYFSQDGPLDKLRGQASQIQTKQLDHLKHAQPSSAQ